jgi:cardiolipin synthase
VFDAGGAVRAGRDADALLTHHAGLHDPVSDCPILDGNRVVLLPDGKAVVRAVMEAIKAAERYVHLEYYTADDVTIDGQALFELLERTVARGVEVALTWDGVGSGGTPDQAFDRLQAAGVRLLEYHSVNPLRARFDIRMNDRDHRKLTVVDGQVAILGGANMSKVYETPRSTGRGRDADHAFWIDNGIRIEGPAVGEIHKLFFHTWDGQGGDGEGGDNKPLRGRDDPPPPPFQDGERIRVDGSAPAERRPLYNLSMRAAIAGARSHIILATGYFVPDHREWKLLVDAARRGVEVQLLLPGYSDVQSAVHAARALYGRLLRAGVRIHEVRDAMLHAKVSTIDGVLTVIGSSNFDWRSVHFNNEIDAVVLGKATAGAVEAMLRGQIAEAEPVDYLTWRRRSWHERGLELAARLWKRLM